MVIVNILFIYLIFFSCNLSTKKDTAIVSDTRETVTIYDYQIKVSDLDKKNLRDSTLAYIDTLYLYNRINWIYALNDSVHIYTPYSIKGDSLFLDNVYCSNLDIINLKFENRIIELIKSDYDIKDSYDEEMYVYWNHDCGLVALYNYPWGVLVLFDRETMKGFAKETLYEYIISQEK